MDWRAALFGILLGLGVLLAWQGFSAIADKSLDGEARHKAMWKLNGGIACAALSMVGIVLIAPG